MDTLISLGPYYNRNIGHVREAIRQGRERHKKTMIIGVTAPITAPMIEVAVDTHAVWVLGFRTFGASSWWEFPRTGDLPSVPGPARPILGPPASYELLGLNYFATKTPGTHIIEPWRLLQDLADFNGKNDTESKRKNFILLIFLVSEAVRFDSMQGFCYRYVSNAARYFLAPDFYYKNQQQLTHHTFDFNWSVKRDGRIMTVSEIVDSWRRSTEAGSRDVMLPPG